MQRPEFAEGPQSSFRSLIDPGYIVYFIFIFSRPPFAVISMLSLVSISPIALGRMNYGCLGRHLVNMSAVTRLYAPFQQTYH